MVFLENGVVSAQGGHEELLARNEQYRALVSAFADDAAERQNPARPERIVEVLATLGGVTLEIDGITRTQVHLS